MDLMTVEQAAKILDVHPRTIRRYIDNGTLRGERIGGIWRIPEDALKAMFDDPKLGESIAGRMHERTEDMTDLYKQGRHRLQQKGCCPLMTVLVVDPKREPWLTQKSSEWMTKLNGLGKDAEFDFTMTRGERGLYRWVLIASYRITQTMLEELNALRERGESE